MGYEMSKPDLRAELEGDLKLVSEGRKDKQSVLLHHIRKYKNVFIESVRKAKKSVENICVTRSDRSTKAVVTFSLLRTLSVVKVG